MIRANLIGAKSIKAVGITARKLIATCEKKIKWVWVDYIPNGGGRYITTENFNYKAKSKG